MRGYIPPINDQERIFCKRVQDIIKIALNGKLIRFLPFLNDREQILAMAVFSKEKFNTYYMFGGYKNAQRKMLAVYSNDISEEDFPVCAFTIKINGTNKNITHRDFLGALMGLRISRENLGDIIINDDSAVLFAHNRVSSIIENELLQVGSANVSVIAENNLLQFNNLQAYQGEEKTLTISSLRLDAAIAAFTKLSRGKTAELISGKRVEINQVPTTSGHEKIYEQDVFTVKGIGKYKLCKIGDLSKKGKTYITYITFK